MRSNRTTYAPPKIDSVHRDSYCLKCTDRKSLSCNGLACMCESSETSLPAWPYNNVCMQLTILQALPGVSSTRMRCAMSRNLRWSRAETFNRSNTSKKAMCNDSKLCGHFQARHSDRNNTPLVLDGSTAASCLLTCVDVTDSPVKLSHVRKCDVFNFQLVVKM